MINQWDRYDTDDHTGYSENNNGDILDAYGFTDYDKNWSVGIILGYASVFALLTYWFLLPPRKRLVKVQNNRELMSPLSRSPTIMGTSVALPGSIPSHLVDPRLTEAAKGSMSALIRANSMGGMAPMSTGRTYSTSRGIRDSSTSASVNSNYSRQRSANRANRGSDKATSPKPSSSKKKKKAGRKSNDLGVSLMGTLSESGAGVGDDDEDVIDTDERIVHEPALNVEFYRQSTGMVDAAVGCRLVFRNVTYTVQNKNDKSQKAKLLTDVTGRANPGEMVALMGASGAGKSTLLDVIAQRKNTGTIEGEITYNGECV